MYEKVEPTSIAIMKKRRYHGHNTICEKLREIFILTDDEVIKMKCRLAMTMAKKMHNKLKEYKEQRQILKNGGSV